MAIAKVEFDYVCDFVRKQAGIVLEAGKEYLVEARLRPILASEGLPGFPELVGKLKSPGTHALQEKVVTAMTTNETSFFRDQQPFDALRDKLVPELLEKRKLQRSLSIWCAASSTGQEPFTIAMTLADHFPQLASWRVSILATDLSPDVLARAREGKFGQIEINRGLPARSLVKHFTKSGLDWQINPGIRQMVEFRSLNLTLPWPAMGPFDIIFIRNVLIYFDIPTKKTILGKARGILRPDGYLFLGAAETTLGIDDAYERVPIERSGCYRLAQAAGGRNG